MFGKILAGVDKVLTFFEEWTLFLSVMVVLIALFFNIILRYGFNYSLAWSEELVREVIMYTTFIGCSVAVKTRSMIKVDALLQLVPSLRLALMTISHAATIIFSFIMIYYGYLICLQQAATSQKTIILQIPMVILYSLLPAMGTLMLIRTIQVIYQDIMIEREKREKI